MAELRKMGIRFTAEGVSEYRDELRSAGREARRMSQETKLAMAELGSGASSVDKYRMQMNGLNKQYDTQQGRLKTLTRNQKTFGTALKLTDRELTKSKRALQDSTRETARLHNNYRKMGEALGWNAKATKAAKAEWQASAEETKNLSNTVKELERDSARYSKELEKMPGKINGTKLEMHQLNEEMKGLTTEYINSGGRLADFSDKLYNTGERIQHFSHGMRDMGRRLTTSVTMPLVGIGVAATRMGIQFESQMQRVKAVSGATETEFANLTEEAKRLGRETVFSAREAADGMEIMATAGFSATEIIGAMSGVMDLAAVSGGDIALASEAAATAVRAFGMEASETTRVADVFAKAATDSNAQVKDMAEAMTYAAPVAHSLGLSLEDTAAAIGIMSDAGIKGSMAGTTLRSALTRLANPSAEAARLMEELGLNMFQASGEIKPMNELVAELEQGLSGMTKEQRAAALSTLFGQRAISGFMALLEAGPDKVAQFSNALQESEGAAKSMADTMMDSTEGQLKKMMSALESAAIELTNSFAPVITEVAEIVRDMANKFSELSTEQQMNIVKWAGIAAAAGPVLTILGNMGSVIGGTFKGFSLLTRALGMAEAKLTLTGTLFGSTTKAVESMGTAASVASGAGGVGAMTGALSALSPVLLGIVGVGGALALGYGAWKVFGEEAWKAGQRTRRWGEDVGEATDKALTEIQGFANESMGKFSLMEEGLRGNVDNMVADFQRMGTSIENDIVRQIDQMQEAVNRLPEAYREAGQAIVDETIQSQQQALEVVKTNNERVAEIRQRAAQHNRQITLEEGKMIRDLMAQSAQEYLKITINDADARREVLAAMTGDVENASLEQAKIWIKTLGEQRQKTKQEHTKQLEDYRAFLDEQGILHTEAGQELVKLFEQARDASTDAIDQQIAMLAKKYPELAELINFATGNIISGMDGANQAIIANNKKMIDNFDVYANKLAETAEKNAEKLGWLGDEATEAGRVWNSIVLDEKTGEVKSNAREEVVKAAEDTATWNMLRFNLKNADLHSNARAVIGEAAVEHGYWEGMSWEDKQLVLNNEFSGEIYKALEESGQWNELSLEEKKAVVQSNTDEKMTETLAHLGLWNEYEVELKKIEADNYEFMSAIHDSQAALEVWAGLDPELKELLLENSDVMTKIFQSEEQLQRFNMLPVDMKEFLAENGDFMAKVMSSEETYQRFRGLSDIEKQLLANNTQLMNEIMSSEDAYEHFKQSPDILKRLDAMGNTVEFAGKAREELELVPNLVQSHLETHTNANQTAPYVQDWNTELDRTTSYTEAYAHMETNASHPTVEVQNWNKAQSETRSTNTNAKTSTNAAGPTHQVEAWNSAQRDTYSTNTMAKTATNAPVPTSQVNAWNEAQGGTYSTNTRAQTATNAPVPTSQVNAWNSAQAGTRSTNTRATTSTNARSNTGAVHGWNSAVRNAPSKKTSVFETIKRTITQFFRRETGDRHFPGGDVWLGDGGRREPYLTPSGHFGVSGNNWELYSLPKGTRIWPSRQAFRTEAKYNRRLGQYMDQIPKFAKGGTIHNAYDGYTGLVGEAGPEIFQVAQGKVSITPISRSERTRVLDSQGGVNMEETNNLLQQMIHLLAKGQVIEMDSRAVGRSIYGEMDGLMSSRFNRRQAMNMRGD